MQCGHGGCLGSRFVIVVVVGLPSHDLRLPTHLALVVDDDRFHQAQLLAFAHALGHLGELGATAVRLEHPTKDFVAIHARQ